MKKTTLIGAAVIGLIGLTSAFVVAQTTHNMDHSSMAMSDKAVEGAVHAKAVINSLSDDMVNVSHDPIPEIGWPAMTMDMPLTPTAEMMDGVKAGDAVMMMLVKGEDGIYAVQALMPAE